MTYPPQPSPEPTQGFAVPPSVLPPSLYAQQPPLKKKTAPWVTILAGLGILVAVGVVGGMIVNLSTARRSVAMGTPVRVGGFEVTVTGMDCSQSKLGVPTMGADTQGRFCVVGVTVVNVGTEPDTFFSDDQWAHDAAGVEYRHNSLAEIYTHGANLGSAYFNPGDRMTGQIVFDVPKSTTLTELWLHDGSLSADGPVALAER
jgi:hypothetical protein